MNCVPDLVYDVGMHNGDDTAYYLHKGYRVVAVEANPELIPAAEHRFARQIADGRLRIVNVAVADHRGELDLFVSSRHDLLGSTNPAFAARFGGGLRQIRVACAPFTDLLDEFGVPAYLKIDIEGSDRLCLEGLGESRLPDFVSIEMSHEDGDRDIRRLRQLGYRGFKCVRQNDLRLISPDNLEAQLRLRRLRAAAGLTGLAVGAARRLARVLRPVRDGDWRFPRGASGRFGPGLPGGWLTEAEMLAVWQALHDIDAELGGRGVGEWFDIHAALGEPAAGGT